MKTTDEKRTRGLQKELRKRLYEMGLRIQLLNAGNQEQVKELIDGICELIGFAKLTTVEDEKNLFPPLAISAPLMVSLLEQEQERIHEVAEKLCISIEHWENSFSTKEKSRYLINIRFGFHDWMTNLLQYLNKQELLRHELSDLSMEETEIGVVAA